MGFGRLWVLVFRVLEGLRIRVLMGSDFKL